MADKDVQKDSQNAWWQPAVMMFAKLSGWIAAPIVISLYLGKWLDKKYDSAPRYLLICIGTAFFISMIGLVKESIKEYKKIDHLGKIKEVKQK
jgi:hypothetical protein